MYLKCTCHVLVTTYCIAILSYVYIYLYDSDHEPVAIKDNYEVMYCVYGVYYLNSAGDKYHPYFTANDEYDNTFYCLNFGESMVNVTNRHTMHVHVCTIIDYSI